MDASWQRGGFGVDIFSPTPAGAKLRQPRLTHAVIADDMRLWRRRELALVLVADAMAAPFLVLGVLRAPALAGPQYTRPWLNDTIDAV